MAWTSAAEPSSAMEETPNWLEMPQELMGMILQRLGAVEILDSAQKVCTTWRRVCKDPAMWKVIDLHFSGSASGKDFDVENLTKLAKQAVHRSRGELIDINIEFFGSDDLLDHISRCSSKLNCLCLVNCHNKISSSGFRRAIKRLPHLEKLHIVNTHINAIDIKVIGRSCPLLKSFKMNTIFTCLVKECDDALAIANNMPELRHLRLFGSNMTNNGLQAILHGCPHLESLDIRRCLKPDLGGNLGKLCMERITDLKLPLDSTKNWVQL